MVAARIGGWALEALRCEALDADGGGAADANATFGQLDELLEEMASKS